MAFGAIAFVGIEGFYDFELSLSDLLAGPFDLRQTFQRTLSAHLASFLVMMVLCLVASVGLHRVFANLARALAESEARSAELKLVNDFSATLAGQLDTQQIGYEFVAAVRRALDERATVALVVLEEPALLFRSVAEVGPLAGAFTGNPYALDRLPPQLRSHMLELKESLLVADTGEDPARWNEIAAAGLGGIAAARSFAAVPIVSRERPVGALVVLDDRPGALTAERLRVPTILARTVAGSLFSARSVAEAEARAQREAVANTVATLTLSTLDGDSILRGAAERLGTAMHASRVLIWMGASPATLKVQHEWSARAGRADASGGCGRVARLAAHAGTTIAVADLRADERLDDPALALPGEPSGPPDALAALATPISLAGQIAGVLAVEQTARTRTWTSDDVRLIEAVAHELRIAVETVRMFEARKRESERMVALSRISAALAAQTDPSVVVDEILENAVRLVGRVSGSLVVWVEEARVLRVVRDYNMPEGSTVAFGRPGEGAGGRAFATQAPVIVNDYATWDGALPHAKAAGERAAIAVPLMRSGRPLGALVIHSFEAGTRFTDEDARLLSLFADQAVSALTSAEAFQKQAAAVQDLERLSKAKSDFISIVSHEFRTPLTGIQGFAEMMRDEALTLEEMQEYAGDIYKDARRLNRMINEMLDLDRMESGRMQLNPEPVDINDVIRDVIARIAPTAPAHAITTDLGDVPRLTADRDKLVQVMTNLLSNAVKYSPDGGSVRVTSAAEGEVAHVSVEDHGMGIPADSLEKVFERFSRIETQTTRYIQGTGLGLPIVRQIVEMHGGRAWAESTLGKGSTFHVTLPLAARAV